MTHNSSISPAKVGVKGVFQRVTKRPKTNHNERYRGEKVVKEQLFSNVVGIDTEAGASRFAYAV